MSLEQTILSNLIGNEEYSRRVLPFLSPDYFGNNVEKKLFLKVAAFIQDYNGLPTKETLAIEFDKDSTLGENEYRELNTYLEELSFEKKDLQWLIDTTEEFCKEKAVHNAILKSIGILDGDDRSHDRGSIPTILSDALSVSFDNHIGHDFIDDAEERFAFYHKKEEKLAFDLDLFNKITKGGLPSKTLNVLVAGTGAGKSLTMCHMAAANLLDGKNVLYITLEMAEERIAERIDANLLDIPINDLETFPKKMYDDRIGKLRTKTTGKLIVKEYPTASVGAAHFRHLMNELALKKNFKPDVLYLDYLNLCLSSRLKGGSNVNSYTYVKAIAEEIRGLAVEKDIPIVTATQLNRSGYTNSDPGLEDTSESFGLPATADFMCALITSEHLEEAGQLMVKQLKNRYNDPSYYKRFVIGIDRSKMRLYDCQQTGVMNDNMVVDDTPVMDNTEFGRRSNNKKDFSKLFD